MNILKAPLNAGFVINDYVDDDVKVIDHRQFTENYKYSVNILLIQILISKVN